MDTRELRDRNRLLTPTGFARVVEVGPTRAPPVFVMRRRIGVEVLADINMGFLNISVAAHLTSGRISNMNVSRGCGLLGWDGTELLPPHMGIASVVDVRISVEGALIQKCAYAHSCDDSHPTSVNFMGFAHEVDVLISVESALIKKMRLPAFF